MCSGAEWSGNAEGVKWTSNFPLENKKQQCIIGFPCRSASLCMRLSGSCWVGWVTLNAARPFTQSFHDQAFEILLLLRFVFVQWCDLLRIIF